MYHVTVNFESKLRMSNAQLITFLREYFRSEGIKYICKVPEDCADNGAYYIMQYDTDANMLAIMADLRTMANMFRQDCVAYAVDDGQVYQSYGLIGGNVAKYAPFNTAFFSTVTGHEYNIIYQHI